MIAGSAATVGTASGTASGTVAGTATAVSGTVVGPAPAPALGPWTADPAGLTYAARHGEPVAPPGAGSCDVWLVPVRHRAQWAGLLDPAERERLAALGASPAAAVFLTSRGAQRLVAARYSGGQPQDTTIDRGCELCGNPRHGRPRIHGAPIDYSVSHAGRWLLMAVVGAAGRVGADLDAVPSGRDVDGMAAVALTADEHRGYLRLPRPEREAAFLTAWVRKEAAMKLTGLGLAAPPARIDVSGPRAAAHGVAGWPPSPPYLTPIAAPPGYAAALATPEPLRSVRRRTL